MFKAIKKAGAKLLGMGGPKANPMAKAAAAKYQARGAVAGAMTEARLANSASSLNSRSMASGYAKAGKVAPAPKKNMRMKPKVVAPVAKPKSSMATPKSRYKPVMTVARQGRQR